MNDIIILFNLKESEIELCEDYIKDGIKYTKVIFKPRLKPCPRCSTTKIKLNGYKERIYNNPTVNHIPSKIQFMERRFLCKECKKSFYESNPFAYEYKHGSTYETTLIMDYLKKPDFTFSSVAKLADCSITKVEEIFDKHFSASRKPLPKILSIDEFYDPATGIGKYDCLFVDFETNTVIDVYSDRSKYTIARELQGRTRIEQQSVKFISIDMWESYRDLAKTHFTKAKVCVDSFHVIKNILKALDSIRIRVMNRYDKKTKEYYLLKKFNFLLLKNADNIPLKQEVPFNHVLNQYIGYVGILSMIIDIDDELKEAYLLKEKYIKFNDTSNIENAEEKLLNLINDFFKAKAREYIEITKMLKNWKKEIVNSFNLDCNGRRINNSLIESRNAIIKKIIRNANGYKNFNRLRNRIIYCINNSEKFSFTENEIQVRNKYPKRGKYNKTSN